MKGSFAAGALWFGAAVSIAEIEAGCQIGDRWGAMLLGHLVGGLMLFAIGLAGAQGRQGASPIGPTMTAVLTAAIVTFAQVISRPKHSAKRNAKTELAI